VRVGEGRETGRKSQNNGEGFCNMKSMFMFVTKERDTVRYFSSTLYSTWVVAEICDKRVIQETKSRDSGCDYMGGKRKKRG
jgi:hypothetical protein